MPTALLLCHALGVVLTLAEPPNDADVSSPSPSPVAPTSVDGPWVPLFNGTDLEGWTYKETGSALGEDPSGVVSVRDGRLVFDYADWTRFGGRFGHLCREIPHERYRIRAVYRFFGEQAPGGPGWAYRNSGIMIHAQDPATMRTNQEFPVSIEVQLLGGFDNRRTHRPTANLCTPGTNVEIDGELRTQHCINSESGTHRPPAWVTVEVEVHGDEEIVHRIDGKEVMRYQRPQLDPRDPDARAIMDRRGGDLSLGRGWIALQGESHPVEFKSVELQVIPDPKVPTGDPEVPAGDQAD